MTDLEREINRIKEIIATHEGKRIIAEGAETRNMKAAKHYLYDEFGYDEQRAMKFIGAIKTDMPNSRLAKCKFILGVVRMACDGQLHDGKTIMSLNKCLKYVASDAHVNEYDNDLNGLSAEEIINRFSGVAQADLDKDKAEVGKEAYDISQSQYKIVKINSFEEAEQYGDYTSWCVTHYPNMFDSYTSDGEGVFYFCLRNGFENEPEEIGEGCPLDSYGLSMIAVSINSDGSVNTITCRWNHDNGGNDNIMTPKELSKVINMNFYEVFKPKTKEEIEKARQQKIDKAVQYILENFDEVIRTCEAKLDFNPRNGDKVKKDFYAARVHDELFIFNLEDIKTYHKLLINMPFDDVLDRTCDMISVIKNYKYNFVSTKGQLISPNLWFDNTGDFYDGCAIVEKNDKWNLINTNGQIISPNLWFDEIYDFNNGYARVTKDYKYNFINAKGQLLSNSWFDYADDFNNGYAQVKINGKWNYINTNGQILFPSLWFDFAVPFHDGYAKVKIDHKWNLINTNGQLKYPNLWFDNIGYFHDGYAQVGKDGKWNFINTKGQLVSPNLWFDSIDYINDGHAVVQIDGKREDIPLNR